jgi:hypothetical protein
VCKPNENNETKEGRRQSIKECVCPKARQNTTNEYWCLRLFAKQIKMSQVDFMQMNKKGNARGNQTLGRRIYVKQKVKTKEMMADV